MNVKGVKDSTHNLNSSKENALFLIRNVIDWDQIHNILMLLSIIIIIARNLQDTIKAQYVTGGRERTLETRLLRFLQINSTYKVLVK